MRSWNMTVQWWFANVIYKRLPKSLNKVAKVTIVMGASAYWHGFKVGYYYAFLGMAVFMQAEDLMKITVKSRLPPRGQTIYDWFGIVMTHVSFAYLCIGFQLQSYNDVVRYYSS